MIEIKALNKTFPSNQGPVTVLDDIYLNIPQGEIFAIIGQSGAGKSTLLRCLNRLETPSSGEILIDGEDITQYSESKLRALRHKISFIFQHFNLIENKTVYDNVTLALKIQGQHIDEDHINQLLKLVDIEDKKFSYPKDLSGGQKQRVAIARALALTPEILLCDEATSALDPETTRGILSLLKDINQQLGLTIVLITHEIDVVKSICQRYAVMENGRVIEVTALEDIFSHKDERPLLLKSLTPKLPDYLKEAIQTSPREGIYPLCQIIFFGQISAAPVISDISRRVGIDINIMLANIDAIDKNTFGILIVQLIGNEQQIEQAFSNFTDKGLTVEVIGYV